MPHLKRNKEKFVSAYKVAVCLLGAVAAVYSICFLSFYYSYRGKFVSKDPLTAGDLVNIQFWTKVLLILDNAWLTAFITWIGLWIFQFIFLRRSIPGWIMAISFAGFVTAFTVDYIFNLNSGPGSWYAEISTRTSKR